MKNKRYLKPVVEKTLAVVTAFMIAILAMVDDFELSFTTILIMVVWVSVIAINLIVLKKWGRGLLFENED